MLRKVYLTNSLPESSLISPKTHPDLLQSLSGYRKDKDAYRSDAPPLRPHPLEKYDRRRGEEVDMEERDEQIIFDTRPAGEGDDNMDDDTIFLEDRYGGLISSLPKHVQARAWRLLPFLLDKDTGDLNMRDLLYDLVVNNVKKIHSHNLVALSSVYRQLDGDLTLPKGYYTKKPLPRDAGGVVKHGAIQAMQPAPPGKKTPSTRGSAATHFGGGTPSSH